MSTIDNITNFFRNFFSFIRYKLIPSVRRWLERKLRFVYHKLPLSMNAKDTLRNIYAKFFGPPLLIFVSDLQSKSQEAQAQSRFAPLSNNQNDVFQQQNLAFPKSIDASTLYNVNGVLV